MKRIIACLIGILAIWQQISAQCNTNPQFTTYCGVEIHRASDAGPTFADDCVPGWMASHGSPQIMVYSNFPSAPNKVAYMWAEADENEDNYGEGIMANYPIKKNHKYYVSIRYSVRMESPGGNTDAHFDLVAAQNIHRPSKWHSGNHLPSADRIQLIQQFYDKPTNYVQSGNIYFTANDDYNSFWIYPYTTYYNKMELFVDYAYICIDECTSTLTFNQGQLPIDEPRAGYINIGSSFGGTGTVTVSSTANTTMTSSHEIVMADNFDATVSSGSYVAQILPSGCEIIYTPPDIDTSNYIDNSGFPTETDTIPDWEGEYDEEGFRSTPHQPLKTTVYNSEDNGNPVQQTMRTREKVFVYPNPTSKMINVEYYSEKQEKIRVRLVNNLGVTIQDINSVSNAKAIKRFNIDGSNIPNGMYIVQIIDGEGKVSVKKIQVIK